MRAVNTGMGLIEALAALFVLSIGMLGIALMFVTSLRNSRSALLRTQAISLVSDMADRIRANADARNAYQLAGYPGGARENGCAPSVTPGSGNNCSKSQLAEDDLARWQKMARMVLPPAPPGTATADVQYFAGTPDRYRITVAWQEPSEPQPFSYQTEILARGSP
jgi:type IV pilus assembly protein PilV